jgi:uncharacterized membrane protein
LVSVRIVHTGLMNTPEAQVADDSESWLRPHPESTAPVLCALAVAIALQLAIPPQYTLVPHWPLVVLELLLIVVLVTLNPVRLTRRTRVGRCASLILTSAITLDNTASALLLNSHILSGRVSNDAAILLGSGAAVFLTNIIAFGICYWELDRGGPIVRCQVHQPKPDFMFPQMANPELAPHNWAPKFYDYLYVSVTNVMAFSPTDTMPLARWAKMLMTVQAMVAVSTVALVFARAVNVLG